jgi:hypothetical protein
MRTVILTIGAAVVGGLLGAHLQKRRTLRRNLVVLDGPTTNDIVSSFADYLSKRHPRNHKEFLSRLRDNPEAAQAEAVTFSLLISLDLSPAVNETVKSGGLDFKCTPRSGEPFLVEVTSLNAERVAERTSLPNTTDETGGAYSFDNRKLREVVDSKMGQIVSGPLANVLVIILFHISASEVFGTLPIQELLTGQPKLVTYVGGHPSQRTDLENSIFLRAAEDRNIVSSRRALSAVLLVAATDGQCSVTGLVHPDPEVRLSLGGFGEVPFVRLKEWPIVADGRIETEWTVPQPRNATIYLRPLPPHGE